MNNSLTTAREWRRRMSALAGPPDARATAPEPWYRLARNIAAAGEDDTEAGATLYIYAEIDWFWGVSADDLARDLARLDVSKITVRLNSPGGDVFDGVAIYNLLRTHKATIDVKIDGLAASIASVIAMAGDTVEMGPGAQMMIHDPWGMAIGGADEIRAFADLLDRTATDIAGFYQRRAGGTVEEWQTAMDAETWYTGPEALAAGLVDTAVGPDEQAAEPADKFRGFNLTGRGFRYRNRAEAPGPNADTIDARTAGILARHGARNKEGK